mmetsp:Transcript_19273/g.29360  ORF Transcript_19273/g.29360 Transcript_19273/m.29360 type:complete len:396 (+) Transcript_19273:70-1257(+)
MTIQPEYSALEDLIIWKAFISATDDEQLKKSQDPAAFRGKLFSSYLRLCHRVIRDSEINLEDPVNIPVQSRTAKTIEQRFRNTIGPEFLKFQEIMKTVTPRRKEADRDYYGRCQKNFKKKYGHNFNFEFFHDYVKVYDNPEEVEDHDGDDSQDDSESRGPPLEEIYIEKEDTILDQLLDVGIDILDGASLFGSDIVSGLTNAGKDISDGANKAGKGISDGANKAGKGISDGAAKAGKSISDSSARIGLAIAGAAAAGGAILYSSTKALSEKASRPLIDSASKSKKRRKELEKARSEKLLKQLSPSDQFKYSEALGVDSPESYDTDFSASQPKKKMNFFEALYAACSGCTGNQCYSFENELNDYYMDSLDNRSQRKQFAKQLMYKEIHGDAVAVAA